MRTILAPRASTILYNLLQGLASRKRFLLPANICPIVPITFFKAGVQVEFVDISPATLNMDMEAVEACLARGPESYGGVLYAHTYGDPSTPSAAFRRLSARFPDLLIIDDRCLCVPDLDPPWPGEAQVILYSTGYAKIVDIGFGGYAFVQDHVSYASRSLRFRQSDLEAVEAGYKRAIDLGQPYLYQDSDWLQTDLPLPTWPEYRRTVMDALQPSLDLRRRINAVYNSRIPPELQLPPEFQLWRFNLRLPGKRRPLEEIFAAGLFASSHYAPLDGIMGSGAGQNARLLADQVINLFNDRHYTLEMAEKTAEIVSRSI